MWLVWHILRVFAQRNYWKILTDWKKFSMFYLIACKSYQINANWTVGGELTSYIFFASNLHLWALFSTAKFVHVQKCVNCTINGSISKNLLNLIDLSITFMKYNWLKPISFTSVFEFEVDPYMEWLHRSAYFIWKWKKGSLGMDWGERGSLGVRSAYKKGVNWQALDIHRLRLIMGYAQIANHRNKAVFLK